MATPTSALNDLLESAVALSHTNAKGIDVHEERLARLETLYYGNGESFGTKLRLLAQDILHGEARRTEAAHMALETSTLTLRGLEERLQRQVDGMRKDMETLKETQRLLAVAQTQGRYQLATAVLAALIAAAVAWLKK